MILDAQDPVALAKAVDCLVLGGLLGMPTETVYGLAACVDIDSAVAAVYTTKGRPSTHPLIVHVADILAANYFADSWPMSAHILAQEFWPGPLTLIVPRRPDRAELAAAGLKTVALRCPAHGVALALLRAASTHGLMGIAAPSANRFGRISPTTAAHVAQDFDNSLLILDGGPCQVGIESTIIDCSQDQPVLLRPGSISVQRIEQVLGARLGQPHANCTRAPGTLMAHYAPKATLRLLSAHEISLALEQLVSTKVAVYGHTIKPSCAVSWHQMPLDATRAGAELFATLRSFDDRGVELILVEAPPIDVDWAGVRDRLERAAASFSHDPR